MRGSLCAVGLILLTTLTEGSAFRHPARKELKKSFVPVSKKTDGKTPLGTTLTQIYYLLTTLTQIYYLLLLAVILY